MRRWVLGLLGAISAANGVFMFVAGQRWFETTPGVVFTGPYNAHFVQDVGAAFVAAGLGLGATAWRARYWPAAVAGAGFLVLHAALHAGMIAGMLLGLCQDRTWGLDLAGVIAPALLALVVALPRKGERYV